MFPVIRGTPTMADAALTPDEINARLKTLYAMRDSGVLILRHGDTSTQFRSLSELLQMIGILEGQLNAASGKKRSRVSYISQPTKGYGRSGEGC
jgi:hypothetical protein